MLIDTHAHLNIEPFCTDPEPFIERAQNAGVRCILVPGIDIRTSEIAIGLAERFEGLYAAVGIHPQDSAAAPEDYLKILEGLSAHPKVLAVGEVGLDYYRDYAPRETQRRIFREQIAFARDRKLPLIVHNREADADTFALLDTAEYFNAQFHCYGSDAAYAQKVLERGARISFTGVVTFSQKARAVLKTLPPEKLMLETDCPWMAPVPYRGKQNEPAYVCEVAKAFAEVLDIPFSKIVEISGKNALDFFRIPPL
jgi:TatD DNase family protein